MGVTVEVKTDRYSDAERDYGLIAVEIKTHIWGAHTILGDYSDFMSEHLEKVMKERINIVKERIDKLVKIAFIIKNTIKIKIKEIDGFEFSLGVKEKVLCKYCGSTTEACDDIEAETCRNLENE